MKYTLQKYSLRYPVIYSKCKSPESHVDLLMKTNCTAFQTLINFGAIRHLVQIKEYIVHMKEYVECSLGTLFGILVASGGDSPSQRRYHAYSLVTGKF